MDVIGIIYTLGGPQVPMVEIRMRCGLFVYRLTVATSGSIVGENINNPQH